jgi:hypothetical protein
MLAVVACGLLGGPAGAQERLDMRLADAGFVMRPANTPDKMARLRLIPPHKFVGRTKRGGLRYYLYADPVGCRCVFVGDQRAMQAYRDMTAPPPSGLPGVPDSSGRNAETLSQNALVEDMNSDLDSAMPDNDFLDFLH